MPRELAREHDAADRVGLDARGASISFSTSYSPSRIVVYVSWRSSAAERSASTSRSSPRRACAALELASRRRCRDGRGPRAAAAP